MEVGNMWVNRKDIFPFKNLLKKTEYSSPPLSVEDMFQNPPPPVGA